MQYPSNRILRLIEEPCIPFVVSIENGQWSTDGFLCCYCWMVVLCILAAVVFLRLLGICYIRYIAPWRKEMLEVRKGELREHWERQDQDIRR
jgi:hypothetical protein